MKCGAWITAGGDTHFRVWVPNVDCLHLVADGRRRPLEPLADGYHQLTLPGNREGMDYMYELADGRLRPDPASRHQPHGVHGASRVVDTGAFPWTDSRWRGISLRDYIAYELHVGTFTEKGTFDAAIPRLAYLRELGVTAVELMPVAEFPGARNWGYDGVSLYAPHHAYGGPMALQRLVDACHAQGLAVILDVVYNHLGPEGNYLREFGPYFTDRYRTPWGAALNFDGPGSDAPRRFFLDNSVYWLREYHIDALRLDAIHGIFDFSARHLLAEMVDEVNAEAERQDRPLYLIAESDLSDARVVEDRERGGHAVHAQWLDDFHHALHTSLLAGGEGYLEDFGGLDDLARTLTRGFVYDGRYSRHRQRRFGNSSAHLPGERFMIACQNHDQVANASRGQRLSRLAGFEREKLAAVVLLTAPYLPLIFQGQEYGETNPFHYFVSHGDEALVEAVREGRRREFAAFVSEAEFADPQAESTFQASKLDWAKLEREPHSALLKLYRRLLDLRTDRKSLGNCRKDLMSVEVDPERLWLRIERSSEGGERTLVLANFSAEVVEVPIPGETQGLELLLWTGAPSYGGEAVGPVPFMERNRITLGPWEAAILAPLK